MESNSGYFYVPANLCRIYIQNFYEGIRFGKVRTGVAYLLRHAWYSWTGILVVRLDTVSLNRYLCGWLTVDIRINFIKASFQSPL
jgi:hypothetical protein